MVNGTFSKTSTVHDFNMDSPWSWLFWSVYRLIFITDLYCDNDNPLRKEIYKVKTDILQNKDTTSLHKRCPVCPVI